jgi:hypothetical protein
MDSTILSAADTSWSTQARAYVSGGSKYDGSSTSYGASWAAGDVIGFALDLNANTLTFYKNGVSQGVAFSSGLIGKEWKPFVYGSSGSGCSANFGQRAFAYTAPSGFKALNTANLPAPLVTKSNTVFDVLTWTGNGVNGRAITGLNFSPDFVWIKNRTNPSEHSLFDTVRGAAKTLYSNQTAAELASSAYGQVNSFDAAGFTLTNGSDPTYPNLATNFNGSGIVGWAWDAGTSTVSNTQGSITSQVRANATAGFSIVSYTGTGSNATVGHGLNVAPSLLICKGRQESGGAGNWLVYHSSLGNTNYLILNGTDAQGTSSGAWNNTSPTSTTFSIGTFTGANSTSGNICYAFSPVVGYSSFGSYTGNGSSDGSFVYTGFRPRWLLIKASSSGESYPSWRLFDTARDTYNVTGLELYPNLSNAETDSRASTPVDILSNGFKLRANATWNTSGVTYIFASFAEAPFNYARAR